MSPSDENFTTGPTEPRIISILELIRLAGVARSQGHTDEALTQLGKATESVYNALNAYADVARDPSDRGAIAVLAATVYRPLKAESKALRKAGRPE